MRVATDSEFKMAPTKCRAFCKEFELKVINWYLENGKNFNETARNFQIDGKQVRNWLKDKEKVRFLKRLRKSCQYGRAKFLLMKKELYSKFLDMHKKGQRFRRWWFNSKKRDLVKKRILTRYISYCTDGSRYLVAVIKYPSEENLMQPKCHQQLCVTLLRTFMQSLNRSKIEELTPLNIWQTWTKYHFLSSWITIQLMQNRC